MNESCIVMPIDNLGYKNWLVKKGKGGAGIMRLLARGLANKSKLTGAVIREALQMGPNEAKEIKYEELNKVAEFVLKQLKK